MAEISSFKDFQRSKFPSSLVEEAVDLILTRDRIDESTHDGKVDLDQLLSICVTDHRCAGLEQTEVKSAVSRLCEARGVEAASMVDEKSMIGPMSSKIDLSNSAKSITARVQGLIGRMATMSFEAIRDEFSKILSDGGTHASDSTRSKWMAVISNARGKVDIMRSITNLYLKGAGLGVE